MKIRKFPVILLLMLGFSSETLVAAETGLWKYKFGVFPYMSPVRMDRIYAPVAEALGNSLEHKVVFRTSSSFDRFRKNIRVGEYDFALIGPIWYPVAVDDNRYIALAKVQEPLVSQITVLQDSPISSVQDLRGRTIATPPAYVPVAHMARRALKAADIDPDKDVTLKAFKSVESCYQQLLIGNADACAAPSFAHASFENTMNVKLRSVVDSSGIPNLYLVAHPRVPEEHREKVTMTVISWSTTETGRELLTSIRTKGFVAMTEADSDALREIVKEMNE